MTLPEKLLYYRKKAGLSQLELAERLDVSRQAVSRWESGAAVPSTENLKCLSGLYGVSVDILLNDGADPEEAEEGAREEVHTTERRPSMSVPRKWVIFIALAALMIGIFIGVCAAAFRGNDARSMKNLDELDESTIAPGTEQIFSFE